ncbi:MAG: hypothetical protein BYD32DRAFT_98961 [Podila humilis]|nr:MAG: hypothetical protein BYD32DRAFT_98961 [Podila humilis]
MWDTLPRSGWHPGMACFQLGMVLGVHGLPLLKPGSNEAQTVAALQDPLQESLKRDLVTLKVRTENRERKKRWREQNEDRIYPCPT